MKKLFKWIIIIVVLFVGLIVIGFFGSDPDYTNKVNERYEGATKGQQNCVKTLGEGKFKDQSLEWKLDSCNVPK